METVGAGGESDISIRIGDCDLFQAAAFPWNLLAGAHIYRDSGCEQDIHPVLVPRTMSIGCVPRINQPVFDLRSAQRQF